MRFRHLLFCLALLVPLSSRAAEPVSLLADSVRVVSETVIEARGNVEIFYGDTTLTAQALRYDRVAGRLTIEGPIRLTEADGGAVVLADAAALDPDLRNGILSSARLVLNDQLQLAAAEIARVDGRYTQLYKTVASSCQVCTDRPVPLWQIRARRVIHDQQERQLYFENARFEFAGVTVLALPRMRLPDPTVERATGFLVPSVRATTGLSTGIKLPYFVALGDHADITVTPYLSPNTLTFETRYRQAFRNGDLTFDGAVSRDDLLPGVTRAYLIGEGAFDVGNDYTLSFGVKLTSDPAYLLDYGYSQDDRLHSEVAITRFRRDEQVQARLTNIRTLRASEIPTEDQLPFLLGEVIYERRYEPERLGGEGRWWLDLLSYGRTSNTDVLGRDGLRFGAGADWTREWVTGPGLLFRLSGDLSTDAWAIWQDTSYDRYQAAVTPTVAAELRWPLMRRENATMGVQTIEPIAQIAWSGTAGTDVPNEDSTLVEFDHGNLLSLSRFPGSDRREEGLRGALGLSWSRMAPEHEWQTTFGAARVFHLDDGSGFSRASGLDGHSSDWLVAGHMTLGDSSALTSRNVLDDDLSVTKSETRLDWSGGRFGLGSVYTYVVADSEENRPDPISELAFNADYRFSRHWSGNALGRYDFNAGRAASAGVGLQYRNECINVDFSVSRRFTSSTSLEPQTSASLRVSLAGFGESESADAQSYRRSCGS